MLLDKELINIEENYEQAYHDRLKDLIRLNTKEDPRKTFSMHLGGVIIECLLKKLIVQKYNITKVRAYNNYQWFTQSVYEAFKSQGDIEKKEFQKKCIQNPEHRLIDALKLLDEIYANIPDDINEKLEKLCNPLQTHDCDYIDLRYKPENGVSEQDFTAWCEDFKDVLRWIEDNAYLVNAEGDTSA